MKLRLLEIELGTKDIAKSSSFYQHILGLKPAVEQPNLTVFNLIKNHIDFNVSTHLKPQDTAITFLTDDLDAVIENLKKENIVYDGPVTSHLGMLSISLQDPNGQLIKINQATAQSPEWLTLD